MKSLKNLRLILAIIGVQAIIGSGLDLHAQQSAPTATSDEATAGVHMVVEGLVRDVACPVQNHKSTATNFNLKCALACARSGSPLIILTNTGDMYFPISDQMPDPSQRDKLMPFVGKYVRADGKVWRRNGTRTIVIQKIEELKGVKLKTDLGSD